MHHLCRGAGGGGGPIPAPPEPGAGAMLALPSGRASCQPLRSGAVPTNRRAVARPKTPRPRHPGAQGTLGSPVVILIPVRGERRLRTCPRTMADADELPRQRSGSLMDLGPN
jgi:hypothetical protein